MNRSSNRPADTLSSATRRPDRSPGAPENDTLLTRVLLAFIDQRVNVYLRFGRPRQVVRVDQQQSYAFFVPGTLFARILSHSNEYGSTRWQILVLQSCKPVDVMQRVRGIRPGARVLLHAEGERRARLILAQIDIIEALDIDPIDVSPAYWHTLGNRLAAGLPLPLYATERHAAWLAGRRLF
jgi:hypothetical protein